MTNRTALLAAVLAAPLLVTGCGEQSADTTNDHAIFDEGVQAYRVRGVIVQLPTDGPPPIDLKIRHEHIPDFVGKTGEIHVNSDGIPGMKAMAMDFPEIAPGVSLEGMVPGDKIVFVFKVKWLESPSGGKTPRWLVSAIEPLPADTEISYDNKVGPATPPTISPETTAPTPDPAVPAEPPADDDGP